MTDLKHYSWFSNSHALKSWYFLQSRWPEEASLTTNSIEVNEESFSHHKNNEGDSKKLLLPQKVSWKLREAPLTTKSIKVTQESSPHHKKYPNPLRIHPLALEEGSQVIWILFLRWNSLQPLRVTKRSQRRSKGVVRIEARRAGSENWLQVESIFRRTPIFIDSRWSRCLGCKAAM